MDKNDIVNALAILPELIKACKTQQEQNDTFIKMVGEFMQKRVNATVPPEEIQKIAAAVKSTILATPCAMPDVTETAEVIADRVLDKIQDGIHEKVENMPIKLEHNHYHTTAFDLAKMADEKLKTFCLFLCIVCGMLIIWIGAGLVLYYHSDSHLASQYVDIVTSPYITEDERTMLWEQVYPVGALPNEYKTNPASVRARVKQNQQIIKERRKQAKNSKDNKYSTDVSIQR